MHVELHTRFRDRPDARRAADLTTACVHCGFCLETCPTYLDRRDERDSPRGRIYLVKQLLETGTAGAATRRHLDRCLTCRACETACPSGMQYGELLDIGRGVLEAEVPRPRQQRLQRAALRLLFRRPRLLDPLLRLGQALRPLLPRGLRARIPPRRAPGPRPGPRHARRLLILEGCVQSAATPRTNAAAARVLDRLGISLVSAAGAGCCGALSHHLGAHREGLDDMRRNIDAWWPHIEAGAEAIVSSASGCGTLLADYGRLLAHDPVYAGRARRVSALGRDLAAVLADEDLSDLGIDTRVGRVAVHTPCTLQHGQRRPDLLRDLLARAGFSLAATPDGLPCCGSAGTHSILEAAAGRRLRTRAIGDLTAEKPDLIATANVGCQLHLQGGTAVPVIHWIELLDGV